MQILNFKSFEKKEKTPRELMQKGYMPYEKGQHGQIWSDGRGKFYYDGIIADFSDMTTLLDDITYWLQAHGFEKRGPRSSEEWEYVINDNEPGYFFVNIGEGWELWKEYALTGEQERLKLIDLIWRQEKHLDPFF